MTVLRDTLGVVRRLLKLPLVALVWLVIAVAVFTAGLATGPRELAVAPILLVALYLGWTWRRVHRRKPRARTLYDLTPDEFEQFTADLLRQSGWQTVVVTGGAGDMGADIIGWDAHHRPGVVQCKRIRPDRKVGSPAIQLVLGAKSIRGAQRAIVATTGGFTDHARRLAASTGVCLYDGTDLEQMALALGMVKA